MNIQTILCTIQFSHHPMTDSQAVPKQQSQKPELTDFADFIELPKNTTLQEKRRFKLMEKRKQKILIPQPTPIHKLSMTSMVWYISISQLGPAAWLCSLPAPAHLLISWIWETGKSPWTHGNNWEHQCYQHSPRTESKTEQLLRGQLSLSQPKPGQRYNSSRVHMHWILKYWNNFFKLHTETKVVTPLSALPG